MLQCHRNGVENRFTHIGEGKQNEDNTFCKYGNQSLFPGVSHAKDYGVCKISIQSHSRSKDKRVIG